MQDYKPNSNRFKEEKKVEERKKNEKVVTGKVNMKKKSGVRKFTESFISEEAANVGSYILTDLIIPTLKQTIVDGIRNSAEMIFLGKVSNNQGRSRGSSSSPYVSYNRFSDKKDDRYYNEPRIRSSFDPADISFTTRSDAENVLRCMDETMREYGLVRVSDFCDFADVPIPYTMDKYGWTNLRSAEVIRTRDGYVIKIPRAIPID